jgi:hypothetical protein
MNGWHKMKPAEKRRHLIELRGGACVMCGLKPTEEDATVYMFDFHHRDEREKKFIVSGARLNNSYTECEAEAQKCDVLCANCHRVYHARLREHEPTKGRPQGSGVWGITDNEIIAALHKFTRVELAEHAHMTTGITVKSAEVRIARTLKKLGVQIPRGGKL